MLEMAMNIDLAKKIESECGVDISLCVGCKKCTSGCPVAEEMDLTPTQIMRALQLGDEELVLHSKTIWLCASCETCTTRCPHGVDVARVMDFLRTRTLQRKIEPKLREVSLFNRIALDSIRKHGRMYELGTMLKFNLLTGKFFEDVFLGARMLLKGKLKLLPSRADYPRDLGAIALESDRGKKIAYFSGCSLHSLGAELNRSSQAVCKKLDLELQELKNWVCCGTTPAHSTSHLLATVLPVKNLALMEKKGYRYLTLPCAGCFFRFKAAAYDIEREPELKKKVDEEIGYSYSGTIEIDHLLDTLQKKVSLEVIRERIEKPLEELNVVCYYGCFLTRPPEVTGAEHHEYPMKMDKLMEVLGAKCLDWSSKTDCCGAALSATQKEIALKLSRRILEDAKGVGADAIVTSCPLCHVNLDARQEEIAKKWDTEFNLPVFYFTQLMGLALGLDAKEMGFNTHLIDPRFLLKDKNLL